MEVALRIRHVGKTFGKGHALKDINFEIFPGEIFGCLGPTGAGKTTLIRLITGLLPIEEGSIEIFDKNITTNFEEAMRQIGGIIEEPIFYKSLTGMQNLTMLARMRPSVTQKRILEVAELVGLDNYLDLKIERYSLGMRQRLGLAQALLHNPRLLILDEPTNGLDPAGIRQLWDILRMLAHEKGICVLLSSHLMSEMELICDRVGIISSGQLLDVKPVDELIHSVGSTTTLYRYKVSNAFEAEHAIRLVTPAPVTICDDMHLEVPLPTDEADSLLPEINHQLLAWGLDIYTIIPVENRSLEDAFLYMTGRGGAKFV